MLRAKDAKQFGAEQLLLYIIRCEACWIVVKLLQIWACSGAQ
jgi:hypothetical protein